MYLCTCTMDACTMLCGGGYIYVRACTAYLVYIYCGMCGRCVNILWFFREKIFDEDSEEGFRRMHSCLHGLSMHAYLDVHLPLQGK